MLETEKRYAHSLFADLGRQPIVQLSVTFAAHTVDREGRYGMMANN